MRHLPAFVAMAAVFLAAGCGRQVTDPGAPFRLGPGEEMEVVVSADGDTGYRWELLECLDQTILRFVEKHYESGGLSLSGPGKTGCEVWRFRAAGPGETTVRLGYVVPPGVEFSTQDSVLVYTVRVSR